MRTCATIARKNIVLDFCVSDDLGCRNMWRGLCLPRFLGYRLEGEVLKRTNWLLPSSYQGLRLTFGYPAGRRDERRLDIYRWGRIITTLQFLKKN